MSQPDGPALMIFPGRDEQDADLCTAGECTNAATCRLITSKSGPTDVDAVVCAFHAILYGSIWLNEQVDGTA